MDHGIHNDTILKRAAEIEGYRILPPCVVYAKIGQGGMGAVYRGRHLNLDIDVAIKVLKPGLADDENQFIVRFQREARIAAQINHPNLIHVYDVAQDHGVHYLVMELVSGETARERLARKKRLTETEALRIVHAAAAGLAEAHRRGIVHRDIKPDNILISAKGQVKVADLGLAKAMAQDAGASLASLSGTNLVMGTPQYMPPEQWENTSTCGPAADVWSLGATLYFLLAGTEAIAKDSIVKIMKRITTQRFPDIRTVRPDVSAPVAALITRCTETEPADRFPSAEPLEEALAELLPRGQPNLADNAAGQSTVRNTLVSPPPAKTLARIRMQLLGQQFGDQATVDQTPPGRPQRGTESPRPSGTPTPPPGSTPFPAGAPTEAAPTPAPSVARRPRRIGLWAASALLLLGAGVGGWFLRPYLNRGNARAEYLDGLAAQSRGDEDQAIKHLRLARSLDPSLPDVDRRLFDSLCNRAQELRREQKLNLALALLDEGLELPLPPEGLQRARQRKAEVLKDVTRAVQECVGALDPAPRSEVNALSATLRGRIDDGIVQRLYFDDKPAELRSDRTFEFDYTASQPGKVTIRLEGELRTRGRERIPIQTWELTFTPPVVPTGPSAAFANLPSQITLLDEEETEVRFRVASAGQVAIAVAGEAVKPDAKGECRCRVATKGAQPPPIRVVATDTAGETLAEANVEVVRSHPRLEFTEPPGLGVPFVKAEEAEITGVVNQPACVIKVGQQDGITPSPDGTFRCKVRVASEGTNLIPVTACWRFSPIRADATCRVVRLTRGPNLRIQSPPVIPVRTSAKELLIEILSDEHAQTASAGKTAMEREVRDLSVLFRVSYPLTPGASSIPIKVTNIAGLETKDTIAVERLWASAPAFLSAQPRPPAGGKPVCVKTATIKVTGSVDDPGATVRIDLPGIENQGKAPEFSFEVPLEEGKPREFKLLAKNAVGEQSLGFRVLRDTLGPEIDVASPASGATVAPGPKLQVQGSWKDASGCAEVTVNDTPAVIRDQAWSASVPVDARTTKLRIVATDPNGNKSRTVEHPIRVEAPVVVPTPEPRPTAVLPSWAALPRGGAPEVEGGYHRFLVHKATGCAVAAVPWGNGRTPRFYLGRYEVTNGQYAGGDDQRPAAGMGWDKATAWCAEKGCRLPTSIEWLLAVRGTDPATGNFGDDIRPVGAGAPNPLGMYDMLGNVGEWVADEQDRLRRLYRGGSYKQRQDAVSETSNGSSQYPTQGFSWVGFRIVVDRK